MKSNVQKKRVGDTNYRVSPSLSELAEAQGVQPIENIDVFFGVWPDDFGDEFLAEIDRLRKESMAGDPSL